jgi:hypothetical protein
MHHLRQVHTVLLDRLLAEHESRHHLAHRWRRTHSVIERMRWDRGRRHITLLLLLLLLLLGRKRLLSLVVVRLRLPSKQVKDDSVAGHRSTVPKVNPREKV